MTYYEEYPYARPYSADGIDTAAYQGFWRYSDGTIPEIAYDTWKLYAANDFTLLLWGPVACDAE